MNLRDSNFLAARGKDRFKVTAIITPLSTP